MQAGSADNKADAGMPDNIVPSKQNFFLIALGPSPSALKSSLPLVLIELPAGC
jgi:hypothetical protein